MRERPKAAMKVNREASFLVPLLEQLQTTKNESNQADN